MTRTPLGAGWDVQVARCSGEKRKKEEHWGKKMLSFTFIQKANQRGHIKKSQQKSSAENTILTVKKKACSKEFTKNSESKNNYFLTYFTPIFNFLTCAL